MKKFLVFLMSFWLCSCTKDDDSKRYSPSLGVLNLDFEIADMDNPSLPAVWYSTAGDGHRIFLDRQEKLSGNVSFKMEMGGVPNDGQNNSNFSGLLPVETFAGKNVEYRGWIKTKGVNNGYAALFFIVYGENDIVLS